MLTFVDNFVDKAKSRYTENASKNDNEPPEHCARGLRFHFRAISLFRLPISPSHYSPYFSLRRLSCPRSCHWFILSFLEQRYGGGAGGAYKPSAEDPFVGQSNEGESGS